MCPTSSSFLPFATRVTVPVLTLAMSPAMSPATRQAKRLLLRAAACAVLGVPVFAGAHAAGAGGPAPHAEVVAAADLLSVADLEEVLAPIALYPDPLLVNVLAASVYPAELVAAAGANGNVAVIDAAAWEPSVRAVARIPDVMAMLTGQPEWTAAVGEAFVLQPRDVLAAIQRLRARAYASGALRSTAEQVVIVRPEGIVILPAEAEVVYLPVYQPEAVYGPEARAESRSGSSEDESAAVVYVVTSSAAWLVRNDLDLDWVDGVGRYGLGYWRGARAVALGPEMLDPAEVAMMKSAGDAWKPNAEKISPSLRGGEATALSAYVGVGREGGPEGRIPNMRAEAPPIAARPAPARPAARNRPQFGSSVPSGSRSPFGAGSRMPARPAAQEVERPERRERDRVVVPMPIMPPNARVPIEPTTPVMPGRSSQVGGVRSAPSPVRLSGPRTGSTPSAFSSGAGGQAAAARGAAGRATPRPTGG